MTQGKSPNKKTLEGDVRDTFKLLRGASFNEFLDNAEVIKGYNRISGSVHFDRSVVFDDSSLLDIKPGSIITLGPGVVLYSSGLVKAKGNKKNGFISFKGTPGSSGNIFLQGEDNKSNIFDYCLFQDMHGPPVGLGFDPALVGGGAILSTNVDLLIANSKFYQVSSGSGGAIDFRNSKLKIVNTVFQDCSSLYVGGSVKALSASAEINNSKFITSHAGHGGAMYLMESKLKSSKNVMYDCSAETGGAIVLANGCSATIKDIKIAGCKGLRGAAIDITGSKVKLSGGEIRGSVAGDHLGTIFSVNSSLRVVKTNIAENYAFAGSAICSKNGSLTLIGAKIRDNVSTLTTGAIYLMDSTYSSWFSTFKNNVPGNVVRVKEVSDVK